jgi:hypothetical protein
MESIPASTPRAHTANKRKEKETYPRKRICIRYLEWFSNDITESNDKRDKARNKAQRMPH